MIVAKRLATALDRSGARVKLNNLTVSDYLVGLSMNGEFDQIQVHSGMR